MSDRRDTILGDLADIDRVSPKGTRANITHNGSVVGYAASSRDVTMASPIVSEHTKADLTRIELDSVRTTKPISEWMRSPVDTSHEIFDVEILENTGKIVTPVATGDALDRLAISIGLARGELESDAHLRERIKIASDVVQHKRQGFTIKKKEPNYDSDFMKELKDL